MYMIKLTDLLENRLKQLATAGLMAAGSLSPISTKSASVPKNPIEIPTPDKKDIYRTELDKFFNALHQVETQGQHGHIVGDNGRALGPFQIHKRYWEDVQNKIGGKYKDVVDYNYSKKVMMAFFNKYAKQALLDRDWEKLAKIHNGGPRGYKKQSTEKYWQKVKTFL